MAAGLVGSAGRRRVRGRRPDGDAQRASAGLAARHRPAAMANAKTVVSLQVQPVTVGRRVVLFRR